MTVCLCVLCAFVCLHCVLKNRVRPITLSWVLGSANYLAQSNDHHQKMGYQSAIKACAQAIAKSFSYLVHKIVPHDMRIIFLQGY